MGVINVRYCGYVAVVTVSRNESRTGPLQQRVDIEDQPEGGANALNVNRFFSIAKLVHVHANLRVKFILEMAHSSCVLLNHISLISV